MEFKENVELIVHNDFWYDITIGGYIKPRELLKNEEDIKRVEDAIKVLEEFNKSAEESGIVIEL